MDSVRAFYNKYSYPNLKFYTNKQLKNHEKLLKKILSYANLTLKDLRGKRVLDAGCGTGEKTKLLAKAGAEVVAIDLTENQLRKAEKNCKDLKVVFKQKDVVNDNLEDLGKFDLILCLGVLHHTEDPKKGFYNLAKLLKKNSIIIIALYHKYARLRYRILRFFIHTFVSKDPDKIMDWLLNSRIAKPLRKASLPTLYDRYAIPYESYHTLKEVKQWFRETNINVKGFSDNVKGFEPFKIFEKKTLFFVAGKKF